MSADDQRVVRRTAQAVYRHHHTAVGPGVSLARHNPFIGIRVDQVRRVPDELVQNGLGSLKPGADNSNITWFEALTSVKTGPVPCWAAETQPT